MKKFFCYGKQDFCVDSGRNISCYGCKNFTGQGGENRDELQLDFDKLWAAVDSKKKEKEVNKAIPDAEVVNSDAINHPAHYQGKHECIDEMIALFGVEAVKAFCKCNVYKYRFRAANKNGQEDLDKADWYMDKLIELEKGENGNGKEA